jgi:hypothetical protein
VRAAPLDAAARQALVCAVQANCDRADARHAGDLTLCIYLLQLRELYRWEQGLPLTAELARPAVARWIAEREQRWSALEEDAGADPGEPGAPGAPARTDAAGHWQRLPLPGLAEGADPFDVEGINTTLRPHGLCYGAGYLGPQRPNFFLAELDHWREHEACKVQVCGRELARGMQAPPAALQGRLIVLRRESMARWLWERYEAFAPRRSPGAFAEVVRTYGLDADFEAALPRLLDEQGETLILHEQGEWQVGRRLEPGWGRLREALTSRRADLFVRAVRDQCADLTVTLPTLLAQGAWSALHFWFSAYEGLRAQLHPGLQAAYEAWRRGAGEAALQHAVSAGGAHFEALAGRLLALHAERGDAITAAVEALMDDAASACPAA